LTGCVLSRALAILAVAMGALGCSGGSATSSEPAPPDWFLNPDAMYADATYLTAGGSGPSAEAAQNQAFGGLARAFEADIEAQQSLKDDYEEVQRDGAVTGTQRDTRLLTRADVRSSQKLLNAEVLEQQKVNDTFYALVGMERRETLRIYDQEIDRNRRALDEYRTTAEEADNPIARLAFLQKALVLAKVNERLVAQRTIVADGAVSAEGRSPVTALEKAVREAQANCPVAVQAADASVPASIVDQVGATLNEVGFRVVDRPEEAILRVRVTYDEQPTLESREDDFLRWTLAIELTDQTSRQTLETFTTEQRAGALSPEAVKRRARNGARRAIEAEFAAFLDRTLLGIDPS
jgi:hypothetical protein